MERNYLTSVNNEQMKKDIKELGDEVIKKVGGELENYYQAVIEMRPVGDSVSRFSDFFCSII